MAQYAPRGPLSLVNTDGTFGARSDDGKFILSPLLIGWFLRLGFRGINEMNLSASRTLAGHPRGVLSLFPDVLCPRANAETRLFHADFDVVPFVVFERMIGSEPYRVLTS